MSTILQTRADFWLHDWIDMPTTGNPVTMPARRRSITISSVGADGTGLKVRRVPLTSLLTSAIYRASFTLELRIQVRTATSMNNNCHAR